MISTFILVGNEPRVYRDVIAAKFRVLRPHLEVVTVDPEILDGEVIRRNPHLVVCSHLTEAVETRPLAWVTLYPDSQNLAVISVANERSTIAAIGFDDLLTILDQTERLVQLS
jgi:hypothetical protein